MGLLLDVSARLLEEVIYFSSHVVLNPGTSEVLEYKQFIDERNGREIFANVIREIQEEGLIKPDTYEYAQSESIIDKLQDVSRPFDFYTVSRFVAYFNGAEFGEGAEAVKRLLKEVDLDGEYEKLRESLTKSTGQRRQKEVKRLEVVEAFRNSENKPEWMVLDVIPVIPPDLRPIIQLDGGRNATSDLNDLYRRVITRNNRLKKLIEMNAPSVILMNEKRMLQEAVDALIDNGRRSRPVTGTGDAP